MSVARTKKNLEKYKDKRRRDALRKDLFNKISSASLACSVTEKEIGVDGRSICFTKADQPNRQKKTSRSRSRNDAKNGKAEKKRFCEMEPAITLRMAESDIPREYEDQIENEDVYKDSCTEDCHTSTKNEKKAQIYSGFCFNRTEKIKKLREKLPIFYQEDEIISSIRENNIVFVSGSTGCGKSTQVPQMLLENNFRQILMTQPRRISCVSIAERINYETNEKVAAYRFRFNNNITPKTRIQIVTDGVLLKEMINDVMLSNYDVVIIDEVHDLTINLEVLLPLLSRWAKIRKNVKVILMSATPHDKVKDLFSDYGEVRVKSILYPVAVHYADTDLRHHWHGKLCKSDKYKPDGIDVSSQFASYDRVKGEAEIMDRVLEIVNKGQGSILVFLTSKAQIYSMIKNLGEINDQIDFIPLHASLSLASQQRIYSNRRKCVLATNYAETGLTIPAIKYVIDCGYEKSCISDGTLRSYPVIPISKSSAEQRRGRAGRTEAGECYRIYNPTFFENMGKFSTPQSENTSLDYFLLVLFHFKVRKNIFINQLSNEKLEKSRKVLERIGAIKNSKITKLGSLIVKYPFEPRLSVILLKYSFDEIKLIIAILDSDIEIKREDFEHLYHNDISDLFVKAKIILSHRNINNNLHDKELLNSCAKVTGTKRGEEKCASKMSNIGGKIRDILEYDNLKDKTFNFTNDIKRKIAKILFITYYDHLCKRVHDEYYFNGSKVYIDRNSKDIDSEYFVFQYLTEKNGKKYAVNITEVDKEWLNIENLKI